MKVKKTKTNSTQNLASQIWKFQPCNLTIWLRSNLSLMVKAQRKGRSIRHKSGERKLTIIGTTSLLSMDLTSRKSTLKKMSWRLTLFKMVKNAQRGHKSTITQPLHAAIIWKLQNKRLLQISSWWETWINYLRFLSLTNCTMILTQRENKDQPFE